MRTPLADTQQISVFINCSYKPFNNMQNSPLVIYFSVCFEAETGTWLNPRTELVLHPDTILKNTSKIKQKVSIFPASLQICIYTTSRVPNFT